MGSFGVIYPGDMSQQTTRSLGCRLFEGTATAVFAAYAVSFAFRIAGAADSFGAALFVFAGLLVGYLLADLISGVAHWVGDRFFDAETPVIGPGFIAPFRSHHVEPGAMVDHGVVELIGNTAILALPVLAAVYHLVDLGSGSVWVLFGAGVALSSMTGAVLTNIFHRWVHMDRPPRVARRLQGLGLVISRERHARHHAGSFDRSYCITTGWLNAAFDDLGVWQKLESWLGRRPEPESRVTKRLR